MIVLMESLIYQQLGVMMREVTEMLELEVFQPEEQLQEVALVLEEV